MQFIYGAGSCINNCYVVSDSIQSNYGSHLIIDNYEYQAVTLSNNYILGDITKAMGTLGTDVTPASSQVQAKILSDFKKKATDTSSVAYLLNGNKSTGAWSQGEIDGKLINDGYPFLINNYQ